MKIKGFQEITLIDYPGKIACTLFLFGCNFKCGFCHNPELVVKDNGEEYSEKEVLDFLEKRKGLLDGVCITGGEPLLTLEEDFLRKIKDKGYFVKIDTNGSSPEKLKDFIEKGLVDFVAMDVKSGKKKYSEIANSAVDIGKIEESIKIVGSMNNYEFRTTIIEEVHDIAEIMQIARWLEEVLNKKVEKFCLQGFKNNGKFIDEKFKTYKNTSEEYLNELKEAVKVFFEEVEVRV